LPLAHPTRVILTQAPKKPDSVTLPHEHTSKTSNPKPGTDLVRATEAAALNAAQWVGRGEKIAGDGAAVEAMRAVLNITPMNAKVVIGEGEKDEAPMLYSGERVGTGEGPEIDLAIDPIEGTSLMALGRPGAFAVIGAAPAGAFLETGPSFYAAKIVVGAGARGAIDLNASTADNVREIAHALNKRISQVTIFVLGKSRHEGLIDEIRHAGARVTVQPEGDVAGAILAALPDSAVDATMGTGGTPKGSSRQRLFKPWEATCRCASTLTRGRKGRFSSGGFRPDARLHA
jgi:fructose-1,6-bisphosphatase II